MRLIRGFLRRLPSQKNQPYVVVLLLFAAMGARAQSGDVTFPTPVISDSVNGTIMPRDIGDARLTRHFYALNGTEGDLLITVESANLNGDVDLFTAVTLRPLAKVTLYAGSSAPTRVTRSVYLRRAETLVLRVEGRTATDADASYTIRFAGAFAPAANMGASSAVSTLPTLPSQRVDKNARRASAVGARLEEPEVETPASAMPATVAEAVAPAPLPTESPATAATPAPEASASNKPNPRRRVRVRPPPKTARTTSTPDSAEAKKTTADSPGAETPGAPVTAATPSETSPDTTNPRRRSTRNRASASKRTDTTRAAETSATPAVPAQVSALLIIVNRDGTRSERDMNSVRRVTVENGMLVVVGRDGKIERQPMTGVLRMSIEPQLQNAP